MDELPKSRPDMVSIVEDFLTAWASELPSIELVSFFTTTPPPSVHDHGQQFTAPFIGYRYAGVDQVEAFFDLFSQELSILSMQLPPTGVDTPIAAETSHIDELDLSAPISTLWDTDLHQCLVNVTSTGRWMARQTQQMWDGEVHMQFRLIPERRREVEEPEWKIEQLEIWRDTAAVYLARRGQLEENLGQHIHDWAVRDDDMEQYDLGGL